MLYSLTKAIAYKHRRIFLAAVIEAEPTSLQAKALGRSVPHSLKTAEHCIPHVEHHERRFRLDFKRASPPKKALALLGCRHVFTPALSTSHS
jgi:hypothetical protein